MESIYYAKIAHPSIGFTQQIFNLVNSIILAMKEGKRIVVVDEFLKNPEKQEYVPISIFLDLDKLNGFLSKKYAIKVFDKHLTHVSINSITYGVKYREKNISAEILEHFCEDDNIIHIKNDVDLNKVFGDPMIGVSKYINIYYTIKHNYQEQHNRINLPEYAGFLKTDLYHNFSITKQNYILNEQPLGELDKHKFDDILHNIPFADFLKENSEQFLQEIHMIDSKIKKMNVIHLRLEDDAIAKYSKSTDETLKESFKAKLVQKYIENIEQHIDKSDETVLLTYSLENPVIEYLKANGYHYHIKAKDLESGREINAMVDYCIGINCNNVFIGNFNNDTLTGSKFSYFLSKHMPYNVKPFFIDICNL
jgi:hypothetical protein